MTQKNKYRIRLATPLDTPWIVLMMRDFVAEMKGNHFPQVDAGDCMQWMLNVIRKEATWVAVADREIVGTIGCNVCPFDWNQKAWHVYDEWFYVKPAYRKGYDIASRLVNEAMGKAQEAGLPFVFSINSGNDDRIDLFLKRKGFTRLGGILVRMPKTGEEHG